MSLGRSPLQELPGAERFVGRGGSIATLVPKVHALRTQASCHLACLHAHNVWRMQGACRHPAPSHAYTSIVFAHCTHTPNRTVHTALESPC